MGNKKMILVYGFEEHDVNILRGGLNQNNLPICKVINENMGSLIIRDIINGVKIEIEEDNLPKIKVVLFNKLTDSEISLAMRVIKGKKSKEKPIFAAVTNNSIDWEFRTLLNELQEERRMFEGR